MFLENAHSEVMILHSMKIIRDAVQHLNPRQTPVMGQPLYAIGKQSNGAVQDVRRLDVVWDRYITDSMRQGLRERRGHGVRRRVMSGSTIPGNW